MTQLKNPVIRLAVAAACLCLGGVNAQVPESKPVGRPSLTLNVVATNSDGTPVTNLTAGDLKLTDDGKKEEITSLRFNQSHGPTALVVLFDLLNLNMAGRGVVWQSIRQAMPEMPASDALYLYLLVKDGSVYPVHGLPPIAGGQEPSDAAWIHNIGPLLNTAMNKVNQLRPTDLETQVNLRFQATYKALEKIGGDMAVIPGRKELIWATYGIPSSIRFVGSNWFDCTPLLRQLAARYNQANIAIYTLDPGINLNRGQLNRDTLDILTGITGGRSLGTSDIRAAAVRAVADSRASYSLTYMPPTDVQAGKFRKVRVMAERKGIHIQAEEGYFTGPAH